MSIRKKTRHKAETVKGTVKKVTGRLTGNRRLGAAGRTGQFMGNMKQAGDKMRDAFKR